MPNPSPGQQRPRVIVISGGTDGMGRALALARVERGDRVVAIGSNPDKGRRLLGEAEQLGTAGRIEFIQADLSSVAETRNAVATICEHHDVVDALCLFANRQSSQRVVTADGFERTFALYYLSRYLLSYDLAPRLQRSPAPVIVNIADVGMTKGTIHWDDLQLEHRYSTITGQLQAGRANDLLGVAYAAQPDNRIRYVLYHPGFTKSGDLTPLPTAARVLIRGAAALAARPVHRAVAPIHEFIDNPPNAPLTANDRGKELPLDLKTLDPADADRLAEATRLLIDKRPAADGA